MKNLMHYRPHVWTIMLTMGVLYACNNPSDLKPGTAIEQTTAFQLPDVPYFPKNLNIPEDNPMTAEGIKLGRYLFYDGRLSGNEDPESLMSCATCHTQEYGFEVGIGHPRFEDGKTFGLSGVSAPHYTMPLVNLVYNHNGYLWNGLVNESNTMLGASAYKVPNEEPFHFRNIESLVWMSITAPHEMNSTIEKSVDAIGNIPMYKPMFKEAFGTEEVNYERISNAIAQYVRTIVSYRSKFHKWLRHEMELTAAERRGHDLFFSEDADCFHCHGGSVLMTTNQYYNNAKDNFFRDKADRYSISMDPMDVGAYRAPSLINAELRAPYMHDGRFNTLDEVIDFYSGGLIYSDYVNPLMKAVRYRGVQLTSEQKEDLKAFILTLTDHELIQDPAFACPPELEQWSGLGQK